MLASGGQLLAVLLVGGLLCVAVWRFTAALRKLPRFAIRSLALAVVLSPGILVGHGIGVVPLVLLPMYHRELSYLATFGLLPLLAVWLLAFVVMVCVSFLSSRLRRDKPNAPRNS